MNETINSIQEEDSKSLFRIANMWIDINEAVTILKTSRRTLDRQPERQIEELKMQLEQLNEDNRQLAASKFQLAAKVEKMSDDAVEASVTT